MNDNKMYLQIREECRRLAGDLWSELVSFYDEIISDDYEAIVFVTRRCYVLYIIVALCEGWEFDKRVTTDFGVYAKSHNIANKGKVIVVDDIAMRGLSINGAVKEVISLLGTDNSVRARVFALCNDVPMSNRIINDVDVIERNMTLTRSEATSLSIKLIQIIELSGIPYTTFLYPIAYRSELNASNKQNELKENPDILMRYKWNMDITEINIRGGVWEKIISYACRRIYTRSFGYQNQDEQSDDVVVEVPFVFLKDLKMEYASIYYDALLKASEVIGSWFVKSVKQLISQAKDDGGKSYIYLRCLETLVFSYMLDFRNIHTKSIIKKIADYSLKGAFDDDIIEGLSKELTAESVESFTIEFEKKLNEASGYNIDEMFNQDRYKAETYADEILHDVNMDDYEYSLYVQKDIFEKVKKRNKGDSKYKPSLRFASLFERLNKKNSQWKDNVYSSIIQCWDTGIATYKYDVDNNYIFSICVAGEMSALKLQTLFGEKLGHYYKENHRKKASADELWEYVSADHEYSSIIKTDFKEWYVSNNGNMFQYAIF